MLTRAQIQAFRELHDASGRRKSRRFIVEGPKMVAELLSSGIRVSTLCGLPDWLAANGSLPALSAVDAYEVTREELERISTLTTPNQVFAIAEMPPVTLDWHAVHHDLTLVLDGISDPGNMGTMLRIADWFGITQVICSHGSSDVFSPKTVQASMGSVFRVKAIFADTAEFLSDLPGGLPVFGAFLDGEPLGKALLQLPAVLVIGSESHGISENTAACITYRIRIDGFPHHPGKPGAESLNASVAAGILCHEFRKMTGRDSHSY